ncbi:MAG: alpha/beta fold hydrolase [Alphaproteobacteria bacterium]|nr:alpha/beta fold hydrolase [Alphaproteobacteria bacterium]
MDFSFKNRHGLKIVGIYDEANTAAKKGLVFLQHGFSGHMNQPHILVMCDCFLKAGYDVVRFDCTHAFGDSEGDLSQANLTNHADDLEDVIEWARGQDWFREPFILAGHSLGGGSNLRYASRHPTHVAAMAPLSAVISYELMIEAYKRNKADELEALYRDGFVWKESATRAGYRGKKTVQYVENLKQHDYLSAAAKFTMPVLIVVGEHDDITLPEHQQKLYDALQGPKMYRMIEGSEHTFRTETELTRLSAVMDEWLNSLRNNK